MQVNIRKAEPGDAEAIWALNLSCFDYRYSRDRTRNRLVEVLGRPGVRILVAVADDKVVGYVHATDYDSTYADAMKTVLAIAVDKAHRGQGVGGALLRAVEDWAKEEGACGIRLSSGEDRLEAHRFYLDEGYSMRKIQKNFVKYFSGS